MLGNSVLRLILVCVLSGSVLSQATNEPVGGPCDNLPCLNGGSCTVNGKNFVCTCTTSYSGNTCSEASTTSSQQPTTYATSTTIIPGSTTESQTKYPTTTVKNEDTTRGSASVKFTSTNEDTSFMTYPSTTTTLKKISGSVTMFIDISTYGTQSTTTTTHETSAKDHSLLVITISIIGLLVAVICGLLIVIFWRRRIPKGSDKTDKTKLYETLKSPDTKTSNEGDNVYRLVSFENSRPTVRIKGVLGEYNGEFQSNYKSFSANVDYHDEDEHYVTLP